jgi:hypothetical protein
MNSPHRRQFLHLMAATAALPAASRIATALYPRLFWARSHLPSYMDAKSDSNMRATASGQFGSVGIALAADH